MYMDKFDKELIDYMSHFFQLRNIEISQITSRIIGEDCYQIRFENAALVVQLLYDKECSDCEAQIRITNILLQPPFYRKGVSKALLNELFAYCVKHGNMSLWIYELINQSWKKYLLQHGAILYQEETFDEGAVVLIPQKI